MPITGYEVQYQRDDDNTDSDFSDATSVTISTPNTTEFEHENVEGGTGVMWEYRVRAVNGNGAGDWTGNDDARVQVPARDPSAPMLTASAISDTEILLEWNVPQNNGTMITGYEVQQWGGTSWDSDLLIGDADTADTTAFTVAMLTGGEEYFFRVRAAPGGDWSGMTPDNATTGAASATTMTGVPGSTGPDSVGQAQKRPPITPLRSHGLPRLTVAPISPATRSRSGTAPAAVGWAEATLADDAASYEDENLASSTRYYYIVRAVNMDGPGSWSPFLTVATTGGNPDAPMLDAAPLSVSSIRLTWNVPNNNGTPITGYELQQVGSTPNPTRWCLGRCANGARVRGRQ